MATVLGFLMLIMILILFSKILWWAFWLAVGILLWIVGGTTWLFIALAFMLLLVWISSK